MHCRVMLTVMDARDRVRYADLVEEQRLSECCRMVKHIRKGMSMVVPLSVSSSSVKVESYPQSVCRPPKSTWSVVRYSYLLVDSGGISYVIVSKELRA